jgi:hypothetical protein
MMGRLARLPLVETELQGIGSHFHETRDDALLSRFSERVERHDQTPIPALAC